MKMAAMAATTLITLNEFAMLPGNQRRHKVACKELLSKTHLKYRRPCFGRHSPASMHATKRCIVNAPETSPLPWKRSRDAAIGASSISSDTGQPHLGHQ